MKLSEFKQGLDNISAVSFIQPNGNPVAPHFHITEAGLTTKHFIDCGGTVRTEKMISIQLWASNDSGHRLSPQKLKRILDIASPLFENEDLEIEVEYQAETIGRFGLDFNGHNFMLIPKQTGCLAEDHCKTSPPKQKIQLSTLQAIQHSCCSTNENCC